LEQKVVTMGDNSAGDRAAAEDNPKDSTAGEKSLRRRSLAEVVAFVTRRREGERHLLVIHHPTAGLQLPAGTVNLGEQPEEAVIREVAEKTGLVDAQIVRPMGSISEELSADKRVVLRATKIFNEPSFDASSEGFGLKRGTTVTVDRYIGGFAAIIGEPLDRRQDPPRRVSGVRGYVRSSLLGTSLERHLFHLTTTATTNESWEVNADGNDFLLSWRLLSPRPELIPPQDSWLERVYAELVT
jgi:8-oxo-dGTP pyrophosphatase MutT (NUDIX family)